MVSNVAFFIQFCKGEGGGDFSWKEDSAESWTMHLKISANCLFAENFLTRWLDQETCVLHGVIKFCSNKFAWQFYANNATSWVFPGMCAAWFLFSRKPLLSCWMAADNFNTWSLKFWKKFLFRYDIYIYIYIYI